MTQDRKPGAEYRGVLLYRQGYGYQVLTMIIDLYHIEEQCYVVSRLGEFDITEEADHIPSCLPLAAVEVYHILVTDGTEITLTIKGRAGRHQARYIIHSDSVEEHSPFLRLHMIKAGELG